MKAVTRVLLAGSIVACLMVLVPCAIALENTEVTESAPEGADQAEKRRAHGPLGIPDQWSRVVGVG